MNNNINTMGKSYHTKKKYGQRIDEINQARKKQSDESDITVLSTLNQMYNGYGKALESHSRHPSGTKASGLRKRLKGKNRISDMRNRFGEAEEQSSRLRKERRRVNHSVRLDAKKDLHTMMNDLLTGGCPHVSIRMKKTTIICRILSFYLGITGTVLK